MTATRAIDGTQYTNTTGNTLYVSVNVLYGVGANPVSTSYCQAFVNGNVIQEGGIDAGPAGLSLYGLLYFVVPPAATYKVAAIVVITGTAALFKWVESY